PLVPGGGDPGLQFRLSQQLGAAMSGRLLRRRGELIRQLVDRRQQALARRSLGLAQIVDQLAGAVQHGAGDLAVDRARDPTAAALRRSASHSANRSAMRNARSSGINSSRVRKLRSRKRASPSPIRSLLAGTIAVCGIGTPSGLRNSAVTANQSAKPPTNAASAAAANSRTTKLGGKYCVARNTAMAISNNAVAIRRCRSNARYFSSLALVMR